MENQEHEKKEPTSMDVIKGYFNNEVLLKKFEQIMGKKAQGFITSVMQIVSSNKDLSKCDPQSIYNAAATAAILDLPLNNNLQFAALVPYKDNKTGKVSATFQIMWKGMVQLAQRSGQFSTINVTDVRQGELKHRDRLTGECTFEWEQDDVKRVTLPIIGFVSYFRLINGFEKPLYRTKAELQAHAAKYSKTYNRSDSKWNTDFEAMCAKTVIKESLNKWAPLSIDMARAIQADHSIVASIEDGKYEYPDNPIEEIQELSDEEAAEIERITREDQARQAEIDLEGKLKKDEKKDAKK